MKTFATIFLFPWLLSIAMAQPVITNAEDFSTGTVLRFQDCVTAYVYPGDAGASVTWEFPFLAPLLDTLTEWMVTPAATPYGAQFPTATLAEKYSNGSYVFMRKTPSENYLVGFADSSGLVIQYTDEFQFSMRPMRYGDSLTDVFANAFSSSGYDFRGHGSVSLRADAYGTLVLPDGPHPNVLRVRIAQQETDSLLQLHYVTGITTTVSYVWFDGMHASALLKIDSTRSGGNSTKTVSYLLSETSTGVTHVPETPRFSLWPNPASGWLTITAEERGELVIADAAGRVVRRMAFMPGANTIAVTGLVPGAYRAAFRTRTGFVTKPVVIF